jgi:hypothetical protein
VGQVPLSDLPSAHPPVAAPLGTTPEAVAPAVWHTPNPAGAEDHRARHGQTLHICHDVTCFPFQRLWSRHLRTLNPQGTPPQAERLGAVW